MVTPPALGNVMEQSGGVKNERLVPTGCQLRAKRVFVCMVGYKETPHISQDHQDVLVNCVNVEQVVLHLTHNVSKHPQIASQNRCLIHQAKGMCNALAFLKNFQESGSVDRVSPKVGIHHAAHVIKCTQCFGR